MCGRESRRGVSRLPCRSIPRKRRHTRSMHCVSYWVFDSNRAAAFLFGMRQVHFCIFFYVTSIQIDLTFSFPPSKWHVCGTDGTKYVHQLPSTHGCKRKGHYTMQNMCVGRSNTQYQKNRLSKPAMVDTERLQTHRVLE